MKTNNTKILSSVEDVVEALEPALVKGVTGLSASALSNCKKRGGFSPRYTLILRGAANDLGFEIADSVFNFKSAKETAE